MPFDIETQVASVRTPRAEYGSYVTSFLRSCWNALVRPEIRLVNCCPWGLKEFARIYAIAFVYYLVGSIVPLILIFGGLWTAGQVAPQLVIALVGDGEVEPNSALMLGTMVVSFVSGFGAELFYFNQQLRKSGNSFRQVIALHLRALNGSWWEAFKRSLIALGIAVVLQNILSALPFLPRPHQATADMAAKLSGLSLVSFGVLASVLAPFFEEVIFRGCLFTAFRNILRQGRIYDTLKRNERVADYLAVAVSALVFATAHMDWSAFAQLFVLGMVLAELYRRSGSLVCPILLHSMNNLLATLLIATKSS